MSTTAAALAGFDAEDYERRINQAVAEEVRAAMARRRITQAALGRILGLGQSAISRRLSGDVPFDVVEINRIAEATGVDASLLIRTGSFARHLALLDDDVTGQGTLLESDLTPVPYFDTPQLTSV